MNLSMYFSFAIRATYSFMCSVSAIVMGNLVQYNDKFEIVLFFCVIQNTSSSW
jgi:hypothetical protein